MLRRKMTDRLAAWKRDFPNKALLLVGARQVGKSYVIREFGKREYSGYCEINLLDNTAACRALSEARSAQDFISRVSLFGDGTLVEGDTLVFIDEIQAAPDIVTMAKFLVEDGRYSWAFSGSMLGTRLKQARSVPTGFFHEMTMRPLDFEEFCWAIGLSDAAMDAVRDACVARRPVDDYLHDAMLANYRSYLVVGGMPEVVQRFLDTRGNLAIVRELQADLNDQYQQDISKYAQSRALHVRSIFDQLPLQLEGESQRFVLSSIDKNARFESYERDFVWLVNAGVALKTNLVRELRQPLLQAERPGHFKLYQSDVGMLMARYHVSVAQAAYLDDATPNLGTVYENAVAQELAAQGQALRYYMVRKRGEVDFLAEDGRGGAVPIEVKSGGYYHAHAALDRLLSDRPELQLAIVLSRGNVELRERTLYLPHYAIFCLPEILGQGAHDDFRIEVHRI